MSDEMSASPSSDHLGLTNEESIYQNYTASEVLVQVNMCVVQLVLMVNNYRVLLEL